LNSFFMMWWCCGRKGFGRLWVWCPQRSTTFVMWASCTPNGRGRSAVRVAACSNVKVSSDPRVQVMRMRASSGRASFRCRVHTRPSWGFGPPSWSRFAHHCLPNSIAQRCGPKRGKGVAGISSPRKLFFFWLVWRPRGAHHCY
jgi:hypothetical protein